MATQCLGTNRDGGPCSAHVDVGARWCLWHDPEREAERQEWRRRGGQKKSNRARAKKQIADQAMSIDDLDGLLCLALKRVAAGSMQPGVGTAMATIAKTITTIRITGDFEKRLEELERAIAGRDIRRFGA